MHTKTDCLSSLFAHASRLTVLIRLRLLAEDCFPHGYYFFGWKISSSVQIGLNPIVTLGKQPLNMIGKLV